VVQRGADAIGRMETAGNSSGTGSRFSFRLSGPKPLQVRPGKSTKRRRLPDQKVCLG
jgi:hypothetical protein